MKPGAPRAVLGLLPLLLAAAAPQSLGAATVTLTFEGFADRTVLTNQYSGMTFSNAIILSSGITLNELEFPPHSGTNVASDNGGAITISFSSAVQSVSGYFTYSQALTMQAFDVSNNPITTVTSRFSNNEAISGVSGSAPGELMVINSAVNIGKVVITGAAGGTSFTMDDVTVASFTQCDIDNAGAVTVANVQSVISQALGAKAVANDLNGDGVVNVVDVQLDINAALGLGCAGPLPSMASVTTFSAGAIRSPAVQLAIAANGDTIDSAGAAPSAIMQGSAQPVVFSAFISDPKVRTAGVNVLAVNSGGVQSVSGTLQTPGNEVFSLTKSLSSSAAGTLTFAISAAYTGVLRRLQTGTFSVTVVTAASTSGWSPVTPGGYFTMSLPPLQQLSIVSDPVSGGYDTQTYDLVLSNGSVAAWLYIYTSAQWAVLQALQTDAEIPLLLSTGPTYVCAYVVSENTGNSSVLVNLNQALATVVAN